MMAVYQVPGAFTTIQAALDSPLVTSGDIVQVAPGDYIVNLVLTKSITLQGSGADQTIIRGAANVQKPVLTVSGGVAPTVENLTLTDGTQGGIVINGASPTIRNNVITNNKRDIQGSAIYVYGDSNSVIYNNTISKNAHYQGAGHSGGYGAIFDAANGNTLYAWNEIYDNDSWNNGSVFLTSGAPVFHNNNVHHNRGDYGGGLVVTGSATATIENNRIVANGYDFIANGSAGISLGGAPSIVRYNTISDNLGDGIVVQTAGSGRIEGNIVVNNSFNGIAIYGSATLVANDVWKNGEKTGSRNYAGPSAVPDGASLSVDPQLNAAMEPVIGSPVIDAGPVGVLDLNGTRSDLGWLGGRGTMLVGPYRIETLIDGVDVQHRLYKNDFNFESLIWKAGTKTYKESYVGADNKLTQATHALIERPHPDMNDVNGWGSSTYWNPFVKGGGPENGVFKDIIVTRSGVLVHGKGDVVKDENGGSFGSFETIRSIAFDAVKRIVSGAGYMTVSLQGAMTSIDKALTVEQISSNQMPDVPKLDGTVGTTGDLESVKYSVGTVSQTWLPVTTPIGATGTYPIERDATVSIEVVGTTNIVDTAKLGKERVEPARKPGISTTFTLRDGTKSLGFGGYIAGDLATRRGFEQDNVAALVMVPPDVSNKKNMVFDFTSTASPPPEQQFGWVLPVSKTTVLNSNNDEVRSVVLDSNGNMFMGGTLYSKGDEGNFPGNGDAIIGKYGSHGGRQWDGVISGSGDDRVKAVALDPAGNFYVLIDSNSTDIDFDLSANGRFIMSTQGSYDAFLASYDTNGMLRWVVPIGQSSGVWDRGQTLAVGQDTIFVGGSFGGTVDFDRSNQYADNHDRATSRGSGDAFVSAYDFTGKNRWVWSAGGAGQFEGATALTVGAGNSVYVGVRFESGCDFTGDGVADVSDKGMALVKLDSAGRRAWYKATLGPGWQAYEGLDTDSAGNVIAVGRFQGSIDFDPRDDRSDRRSSVNDSLDAFVQMFDADGNSKWVRTTGGQGQDAFWDVTRTSSGQFIISGNFLGTVDFDRLGEYEGDRDILTSVKRSDGVLSSDGVVLVLDGSGGFVQAASIGGPGDDDVNAVATDGAGRIYIAGFNATGATVFDGVRVRDIPNKGGSDGYVARFLSVPTAPNIRLVSAVANGGSQVAVTYDIVGSVSGRIDFAAYRSADGRVDTNDSKLGGTISFTAAQDLTTGRHSKLIDIGTNAGQIPLPGFGATETLDDYQVLFVADPDNVIWEADSDPLCWDNTASLVGVYHPTTGSVYIHGNRTADTTVVTSNSGVSFNGQSYSYALASVTDFRVRLKGGNDTFSAATTVTKPLVVFGGLGDDRLTPGQGNDFLAGGNGDDVYVLDTDTPLGTDTIDDVGGFDWLDFSGTTSRVVTVDLSITVSQPVNSNLNLVLRSATAIDGVFGGSLADVIRGNELTNILSGGAGNDSLYGRGGNDVIFGGAGADLISGDAGDDLLIAGSSPYENQIIALTVVFAEWNAPNPYERRAATIRAGSSGYRLAAGSTVMNDNAVDRVLGGTDRDWFFAAASEVASDRLATEFLDVI